MSKSTTGTADARPEPTGKFSVGKVRTLLRGAASSDFAISVVHKDGRWLICQANRDSSHPEPCFGSGASFKEAWRKAGVF